MATLETWISVRPRGRQEGTGKQGEMLTSTIELERVYNGPKRMYLEL